MEEVMHSVLWLFYFVFGPFCIREVSSVATGMTMSRWTYFRIAVCLYVHQKRRVEVGVKVFILPDTYNNFTSGKGTLSYSVQFLPCRMPESCKL
jgi:hypothetical protein